MWHTYTVCINIYMYVCVHVCLLACLRQLLFKMWFLLFPSISTPGHFVSHYHILHRREVGYSWLNNTQHVSHINVHIVNPDDCDIPACCWIGHYKCILALTKQGEAMDYSESLRVLILWSEINRMNLKLNQNYNWLPFDWTKFSYSKYLTNMFLIPHFSYFIYHLWKII